MIQHHRHADDRERFRRDGFIAPRPLVDADEAAALALRAYAALGVDPAAPGPSTANALAWHHRHRWAYDLATHPRLLDLVEGVLGPDLVLWAMACWYKEPRTGRRVPWHQDAHYWPMSPTTTVSVWLALTPATPANGCLRLIPGSHGARIEHRQLDDSTSFFPVGADGIDDSGALDLAMRPGEVALFDEGTLHGSGPNRSACPRLGLSFRFSPPAVRFHIEDWSDAGRIRTFLVRGEDRERLNDPIRGIPPT
jgi:hypothetical protein